MGVVTLAGGLSRRQQAEEVQHLVQQTAEQLMATTTVKGN